MWRSPGRLPYELVEHCEKERLRYRGQSAIVSRVILLCVVQCVCPCPWLWLSSIVSSAASLTSYRSLLCQRALHSHAPSRKRASAFAPFSTGSSTLWLASPRNVIARVLSLFLSFFLLCLFTFSLSSPRYSRFTTRP